MTELDLFIQDFVTNNKLLGQTLDWSTLVNRRFVETPGRKIFSFLSGGKESLVVGTPQVSDRRVVSARV